MSDPIGKAPHTTPRHAEPTRPIKSRRGEALAKGDRNDASGVDGKADHGKGHASEQPSPRGCHDEISKARDEGGWR